MGHIVVASRKSDLARIQAQNVVAELLRHHTSLTVTHHYRASLGDKNLKDPLWKIPERGVFTQDFHNGLVQGKFDIVVHSWKDLPVEPSPNTEIIATLPRADMRDLLLVKKNRWEKIQSDQKIRLYTSSPRRAYNLQPFVKEYLPGSINHCEFLDIRGNVPTRLQKMFDGEGDGLILAKAAWDRLVLAPGEEYLAMQKELKSLLQKCLWMVLPLKLNPNAPAQGALAIEAKKGREDLKALFSPIQCASTARAVVKERQVLKSYGGGCHQKIGCGVFYRDYGEVQMLKGLTEGGQILDSIELSRVGDCDGGSEALKEAGELSSSVFKKKECFPEDLKKARWFERKSVEFSRTKNRHHLVARALALPDGFKPEPGSCVWTAGLKTWKHLAQRGLWVNGSSESLGEQEKRRLQALIPDQPWLKWTHTQGTPSKSMGLCATYKLVPNAKMPDITGKRNFYWMSGSSMEEALKHYPEILDANHYCGPGNTYFAIKALLKGHPGKVEVRLDYDHWVNTTWAEEVL